MKNSRKSRLYLFLSWIHKPENISRNRNFQKNKVGLICERLLFFTNSNNSEKVLLIYYGRLYINWKLWHIVQVIVNLIAISTSILLYAFIKVNVCLCQTNQSKITNFMFNKTISIVYVGLGHTWFLKLPVIELWLTIKST